jgi:adenylylsulfate kinase
MENNIVWHHATVTRKRREDLNQHKSIILWFTGLSGSGKSTLAHALEEQLHLGGSSTYVFDGDNVRHGLCNDLGFSSKDRKENIRRIGEMAKLFVDAGVIALTAFISPFKEDRENVRNLFGDDDFIEVYCHCSIDECERRDVKGLYKRARAGEISDFTGISSPYEVPENPEIRINTEVTSLNECVEKLIESLVQRGILQQQTGINTEPLSVSK